MQPEPTHAYMGCELDGCTHGMEQVEKQPGKKLRKKSIFPLNNVIQVVFKMVSCLYMAQKKPVKN